MSSQDKLRLTVRIFSRSCRGAWSDGLTHSRRDPLTRESCPKSVGVQLSSDGGRLEECVHKCVILTVINQPVPWLARGYSNVDESNDSKSDRGLAWWLSVFLLSAIRQIEFGIMGHSRGDSSISTTLCWRVSHTLRKLQSLGLTSHVWAIVEFYPSMCTTIWDK